jgi:ribonuclease III
LFSRIFSFSPKRSNEDLRLIRFILKKFGYKPKELSYFYEAITHKSHSILIDSPISNERLEYLGDAILDAVIAELLFLKFPNEDEGYLTKIKSKVVSRKTLSEIGEKLQLRDILLYHKGRSININSLEGNAFEAIIGAIYLDGGFEAVRKTINHHIFRSYADLTKILEEEIDFKSKLFIWSQKKHINIEFIVLTEKANQGEKSYEVQVLINETPYGKGWGSTKKLAEQNAARETFLLLGEI